MTMTKKEFEAWRKDAEFVTSEYDPKDEYDTLAIYKNKGNEFFAIRFLSGKPILNSFNQIEADEVKKHVRVVLVIETSYVNSFGMHIVKSRMDANN